MGPEAFDAACCRSLLRVFAADFARREGAAIDRARLDDALAEFRASRNLGQDTEFTRFLADSDLPAEDFERLIAANEMVRWACGQAEPDALGGFLDDLRLSGQYPGPGAPGQGQAGLRRDPGRTGRGAGRYPVVLRRAARDGGPGRPGRLRAVLRVRRRAGLPDRGQA